MSAPSEAVAPLSEASACWELLDASSVVADASSFASLHGGASPTASGASDEDVTVADAAELPRAAADVDAAPSKEADGDADDDDEIVCEGWSELVLGLASLLSLFSEPESLSRSSALTPPML